jgi:Ca-activated chloride channel family protein
MSEFHFLRPEFLLFIPLVILIAVFISQSTTSNSWAPHIAANKLKLLISRSSISHWKHSLIFALAGLIASLALAGPTWEQRAVPTTENAAALVVLLDLSPSMLAADIQPDRITRARLKITDLLRQREDGQTALIAYSGSAHRVSPLTDDSNTVEALIPALSPEVMPQTGSNIEAAIELALELLTSAGFQNNGHFLVVTDGITANAQKNISDMLPVGIHLSILGVGSVEGAPIPLNAGNFYRDSRGDIVLARLNRNELQILAGRNSGRYIELQADDSDISYLLDHIDNPQADPDALIETSYDSWHDAGYLLIILLIPLALMAFRRDLIFALPFLIIVSLPSNRAEAGIWQDLWQTSDQQALEALEQGDVETAAAQFESADWKAFSSYQAEDYEGSAELLAQIEDSSLYDLGTNLAKVGLLEESLAALTAFVEENPDHENGLFNRDIVAQLLQQQQEQQESQDGEEGEEGQEGEQSQEQQAESDQEEIDAEPTDQQQSDSQESDQPSDEQEQQSAEETDSEESEESEQQSAEEESEEQSESEALAELAALEETPEELSPSSEQWLRAIPDDPSGLLRRKFEYESQLYQQQRRFLPPSPGQSEEERY